MAGNLFPVAGCKIFIGGVQEPKNSDFVAADFAAETWVEIDGWQQMGAVGDTAEVVLFNLINRGRDLKQKGTANSGSMQNVFAHLPEDDGQDDLLLAAEPSNKSNYAFKIELNDMIPGGVSPSIRYFIALVMSAEEAGGGANDPRNLNSTFELNSNIVRVAKVDA